MTRAKTIQAKHIDDDEFLAHIRRLAADGRWGLETRWVMRWEVEECYPDVPSKVVLAKLAALVRRGVLDGCTCGCRGDFRVVGRSFRFQVLREPWPQVTCS